MTGTLRLFTFAASLAMLADPAAAEPVPPLQISYAADYVIDSQDLLVGGRVFAKPGMERREMNGPSGAVVVIMRHDRRVVWTLMPGQQSYVESRGEGPAGPTSTPADLERVGADLVEGYRVTRYRLPATSGGESLGDIWLTTDGVPLRIASRTQQAGRDITVTMTLRNLWFGRLDPALFEIPPGYREVAIGQSAPNQQRSQP